MLVMVLSLMMEVSARTAVGRTSPGIDFAGIPPGRGASEHFEVVVVEVAVVVMAVMVW